MTWSPKKVKKFFPKDATWLNLDTELGKVTEILITSFTDERAREKLVLSLEFNSKKYYPNHQIGINGGEWGESGKNAFLQTSDGQKVTSAKLNCADKIEKKFLKKPSYGLGAFSSPIVTCFAIYFEPTELNMFDAVLNFISDELTTIEPPKIREMQKHAREALDLPFDEQQIDLVGGEINELVRALEASKENKEVYQNILNKLIEKCVVAFSTRNGHAPLHEIAIDQLINQYNFLSPAISILKAIDEKHGLMPQAHIRLGSLLLKTMPRSSQEKLNSDHKNYLIEIFSHGLQGFLQVKKQEKITSYTSESENLLQNILFVLFDNEKEAETVRECLAPYVELFKSRIYNKDVTVVEEFTRFGFTNSSYIGIKTTASLMVDLVLTKKELFELRRQMAPKQSDLLRGFGKFSSGDRERENPGLDLTKGQEFSEMPQKTS